MNDDYLWDRTGDPDPEVLRLEKLLGQFRSNRPAPDLAEPAAPRAAGSPPPWRDTDSLRRRRVRLLAAAAGLAGAALAGWWALRSPGTAPGFEVERLAGAPFVASRALHDRGLWRVGERLETDARSRARIAMEVGEVEVDPGSVLRLVRTREREHRLALDRGLIRAFIWAPPGQFFVETPSAVAVDLGCAYTLEVDRAGFGVLRVETGWVGFEKDGLESFIPAGAMCRTRPRVGPGTPYYEDAPAALRVAADRLDEGGLSSDVRAGILGDLLDSARAEDAFTLWHLLARVEVGERERVFDRMASLVPPPEGVTRDGILRGDRAMLERWWNALGLEDATWWRRFKLPEPPGAG